jgi:hypothetical protein
MTLSSSDCWYPKVPKVSRTNCRFRLGVIRAARKDKKLQALLRQACSQDILFYISTFVLQYNPLRKGIEDGPMIPWAFQERFIYKIPSVPWPGEDSLFINDAGILWCIENDKSLLISKSRDMGISWWCLLVLDWLAMFKRRQQFLCISRDQAAVESKSPDSLFWKLDFLHEHLPKWLCPSIDRTKNFLGYEDTQSTITGAASTGLAGVGGRATAMLIDEFAMIREDSEVRQFTASTTGTRIFNSTHRGLDTEFYKLSQQPETFKHHIHWTLHPDKVAGLYVSGQPALVLDKTYSFPESFRFVMDGAPVGGPRPGVRSPWYDRKCLEIGSDRGVAMDLDMNPSGAVSQFFDSMLVHLLERTYCQPPWWEGELDYDKATGEPKAFVRNSGGRLRLWCNLGIDGRPPLGKYGAGADLSAGSGASNTCLSIAAAETGDKVLEFVDPKLGPNEAAELFMAICKMFTDEYGQGALLAWEITGPGGYFKKRLVDELKYPYIYCYTHDLNMRPTQTDRPGFHTSVKTKRLLLDEYATALRKREFLNRSKTALEECLSWRYKDNGDVEFGGMASKDPSGARDNHGDRVIADALCNKMIRIIGTRKPVEEKKGPEILSPAWRYERFEKMRRTEDEVMEV